MMIKKMKFKYRVIVDVDGKIYNCLGYYDSGNTLIHNMMPVIFMNGIEGKEDINFMYANGNGNSKYVIGDIYINKKKHKVYIASSLSSFNGCDVLLNALLI